MKIRINIKPYSAILLVVFMLLLSFPQAVLSQEEKLAVISEYEGDVKVEHESILKTVKKIGNRIRNSAIYDDGSVITMDASTADLVFSDNTSLAINENTSLTITTREASGEEGTDGGFIRKVSDKQGAIVRNIYVEAGKFLADITPSKSVLTEFETPTGVASVRGTAFTLAYVGGVTSIDLTEGLVEFASAGDDVSFSIEPGDFIDVSTPDLGHTSIGVRSGQLDVATDTGTLTVESGESTGVNVDADTGEVTVTAEEGTVTLETITGTATIEEGASATTSVDCTDTCEISLGAEDGTVEFETSSGKVIIEDGETAGTKIDEETGQVSVTSEGGMIEFETTMGNVMMEEGDVIGTHVDAETGDVIMTAEVGTVEFETAMGNVMMNEGDAMGAHIDAETGDMMMTAEEGTIIFETSAGTATIEEGHVVGSAFEEDSGQVTMTAVEGGVSFETPMGMAVMNEGASVEFAFDDNTGEISMSAVGGVSSLETDNGTISMDEGGSFNFTVNPFTGEMTVIDVVGDVVMTNEDGTTMTIEAGTSLGIMQDEGPGSGGHYDGGEYDGPLEPGYGPGDGYDGPEGDDGDHDGMNPDDFEGNVIVTEEGIVYEGTFTDEYGTSVGTFNESTGIFEGTHTDDTGTYTGIHNEADGSFTGIFVDAYTGGIFEGTFTDYGFTGTYTDQSGQVYTFTDFQQSSFYSDQQDQAEIEMAQQHPGTPTSHTLDNPNDWTEGFNAYTTDSFGPIVTTTTPNTNTGDFVETFGSTAGFAVVHTGFGANQNNGFIEATFNFATEAEREFSFDYNFITTENWNETNPVNDVFTAKLIFADDSEYILATASVISSAFTSVSGLPGDTLDSSFGGQTGWLYSFDSIIVPSGITRLRFEVIDDSDNFADSAVLLDNIVDPPVVASSTDYLLTFAKMLRGDIDIHDADLEADAVASAEHQAFIDKVNAVITDMENSSGSDFVAGQDEFLDRLWVARDSLASHEESAGFLQQTGVAHNLLEASIMSDEGVGTNNISAIQNSLNQAKTFLVAHINDFGETDALANIRTNIDAVLANIDNANNNEFTTATMVAIRQGIKQAFSDTIDNMNGGHSHPECSDPTLSCYSTPTS